MYWYVIINIYLLIIKDADDWAWVDETALDYINWNEGEPNNADDLQYCAYVYKESGRWDDTFCTDINGYICKARKSKIRKVCY